MKERAIGKSGMTVSAMGLGCWAIGGPAWRGQTPIGWGKVDDEESARAIRRAVELGVSFFDTADVYGCGHSERVLGKALAGARNRVVIATKFGNTFDEATKQAGGTDASPAGIRRACEASLRRLGIERIDLYQLHLGALDLAQSEEVRATLEEFVASGKIRAYGWSTDDPDRARSFAAGEHCASIQQQLNVFGGSAETLAVCERLGLASINRGPLAMGLLTGKYQADSILPADDVRGPQSPDWMRFFTNGRPTAEFLAKLRSVREILGSGGRTLAQGALAWLWGRSHCTIPIPGFKSVAQVEENAGALRFGPLTKEQVREVETLLGS
jgi:aryl-alcohol dehydrogenase-like predicted oxidoreductase